jgi:hypothetical protein
MQYPCAWKERRFSLRRPSRYTCIGDTAGPHSAQANVLLGADPAPLVADRSAMSRAGCDGLRRMPDRDPMHKPFAALIGTWATKATHPLVDVVVAGSITFE